MTGQSLTVGFVQRVIDDAVLKLSHSPSSSASSSASSVGGHDGGNVAGVSNADCGGIKFRRVVTAEQWTVLARLARTTAAPSDSSGIVSDFTNNTSTIAPAKEDNGDGDDNSPTNATPNVPFYFGIQAMAEHDGDDDGDGDIVVVGFVTFYVAYSTWDGKMTYVDKLVCCSDRLLDNSNQTDHKKVSDGDGDGDENERLEVTMYRLLARISVSLGCMRLTWKQSERPKWNPSLPPEFLHDWVFFSMDRPAMQCFVAGTNGTESRVGGGSGDDTAETMSRPFLHRAFVERVIQQSLQSSSGDGGGGDNTIRLRLANGREDMDAIARLVKQLAVYEKEPDAVHVTANDYLTDGSASTEPVFYCLLADTTNERPAAVADTETATETTEQAATTTCGMGLFFLGYVLDEGRPYLYLEDLYFEQDHRGKGGGKLVMQQLAQIALDLGCCQFIWTALDWNEPALNFYNRIGAKVQEGVKITRYCGKDHLTAFANQT